MMNALNLIILVSWVVFIAVWLVAALRVKRDVEKNKLQRSWWLGLFVIFLALGWVWEKYATHSTTTTHLSAQPVAGVQDTIGTILTVIGIAFAVWARWHIGRNWSGSPAKKENHELVTSGPYRFVRHPIYTGAIIALFGSALAQGGFYWVLFIVLSLIFISRIKTEEGYMLDLFPDQYPTYKKRTKALLPFVF